SSSLRFMRLATVGSGIAMPPVPTAIAPLAKRGTQEVDTDHATNGTRSVARKSTTRRCWTYLGEVTARTYLGEVTARTYLGEVTARTYLGLPNPACWVRLTSSAGCA